MILPQGANGASATRVADAAGAAAVAADNVGLAGDPHNLFHFLYLPVGARLAPEGQPLNQLFVDLIVSPLTH